MERGASESRLSNYSLKCFPHSIKCCSSNICGVGRHLRVWFTKQFSEAPHPLSNMAPSTAAPLGAAHPPTLLAHLPACLGPESCLASFLPASICTKECQKEQFELPEQGDKTLCIYWAGWQKLCGSCPIMILVWKDTAFQFLVAACILASLAL